jgi:alkaline phosphatase D
MQKEIALLFVLLFSFSSLAQVELNANLQKLSTLRNIKRFAFGSCNNQNHAQPLWADMLLMKPDLFVWGGDTIYADWERHYNMAASYDKQKHQPDYVKVRETTPIIGIWDDHDFSGDNANGRVDTKALSQRLFLDFLDEHPRSPRRYQEGIYTSYEFGEPGKRIKFIMLDNRYFKGLEADAPLLGKKQWAWLEDELQYSKAQLHFIVAGLSVFSPLLPYSEEWWEHPQEVNRMLALLEKYKPQGVVFLTGDKHFGSIFKYSGQLEFLSSGMTHVVSSKAWWYITKKYPNTFFGLNYGLIDIDWDHSIPTLTMRLRSSDHRDIHLQKWKWGDNTWSRLDL